LATVLRTQKVALAPLARVVVNTTELAQVPLADPAPTGVVVVQIPFAWYQIVALTAEARLPPAEDRVTVRAGTVVLVVSVVLATVTLPVDVRLTLPADATASLPSVAARELMFEVVTVRLAAEAVLVAVTEAVQAA
jgi:hypothetical protein